MAVGDLIESLGFVRRDDPEPEDEILEVPDDARELTEDDDYEEDLPKDPKPARRKGKASRMPEPTTKASAADRRQVKDALTLLIKVPAGVISMRDPICGGAVHDQADDIIKAVVPIVCRNSTMLRWFTAANAPWLDILGLMTAFAPVISTVYGHHVSHTIGDQEEGAPDDLSAYAAPSL